MTDHDPLFTPGIHLVTATVLGEITVSAYPSSVRRPMLFEQLNGWLDALRVRGASGRCWIDGSFLTSKVEPNDIDLVIFPEWAVEPSDAVKNELGSLFDKALVKAQFGLDIYIVAPGQPDASQWTSYWRGWYGFCRDGLTAKGIAEVSL